MPLGVEELICSHLLGMKFLDKKTHKIWEYGLIPNAKTIYNKKGQLTELAFLF